MWTVQLSETQGILRYDAQTAMKWFSEAFVLVYKHKWSGHSKIVKQEHAWGILESCETCSNYDRHFIFHIFKS